MELNEDLIEELVSKIPVEYNNNSKVYIILIDGKRFVTAKGKSTWKAKNHAMAAFTNTMELKVKSEIKRRVLSDSELQIEYYRHPLYQNGYELFRNNLIKNGRLKIIELDGTR